MSTVAKLKPDPEPIATLSAAMARAFSEIEAATKSAANPHFKSKYADLTGVIEAIKPALVSHGLFFTQRPEPAQGGVQIETVLHHEGGESLSLGSLFVPANKNDAQAYGSALTYCRRYALVTAFGVPTEDDDGNAASKPAKVGPEADDRAVRPKGDGPPKSHIDRMEKDVFHELEGCGDEDMLDAYLRTDEFKAAKAVFEEYRPSTLYGPAPRNAPEFVPIKDTVARKRAMFRMGNESQSSILDAG